MNKNDIDEFGRCTTELSEAVLSFGVSVVAFGTIQALVTKRSAWLVCNIEREKKGDPIVYRESDFALLADQIQGIAKGLNG